MAMEEDLMHALIHCSHAQAFWTEVREWFDFRLPRLHPDTWARDILCDEQFSEQRRAEIISIMWSIWHSRNRLTHDRDGLDPVFSVRRIKEDLTLLDIPRQHAAILPGHGWRPQEAGWLKINTDGAIDVDRGNGGAGGIVRSPSTFMGAWSKPLPGVTEPLIAETLAAREAVIFAKLRGFSHVVLETDCLEMVDLWKSRRNSRLVVAPILEEIGELASSFISFVIQYVYRNANQPAHLCARYACPLQVTDSWLSVVPSFLVTSVMADDSGNLFC